MELHPADLFHLEIDGIASGSFTRCAGLGSRVEVLEYREGGRDRPHLLRGDVTFSPIVLERGLVRGDELGEWFRAGDRRDGAIVLLGRDGKEVSRWTFERGWPCRWEGPVLDARAAAVALEVLEIAHEGAPVRRALIDAVRDRYRPRLYALWSAAARETRAERFARAVAFRWEVAADAFLDALSRLPREDPRPEPAGEDAATPSPSGSARGEDPAGLREARAEGSASPSPPIAAAPRRAAGGPDSARDEPAREVDGKVAAAREDSSAPEPAAPPRSGAPKDVAASPPPPARRGAGDRTDAASAGARAAPPAAIDAPPGSPGSIPAVLPASPRPAARTESDGEARSPQRAHRRLARTEAAASAGPVAAAEPAPVVPTGGRRLPRREEYEEREAAGAGERDRRVPAPPAGSLPERGRADTGPGDLEALLAERRRREEALDEWRRAGF